MQDILGLTTKEVEKKRSLGLVNKQIDSYTPSTRKIIFRNLFTLMHTVLMPLIALMFAFELYREGIIFAFFIFFNTIINSFEEIRVKNRLDKLKSEFVQTAKVIRDGKTVEIPVNEIVEGDYLRADEGEPIIVDGKIVHSYYLQLDESALTGESNYVSKEKDQEVRSGSFVVTGECIYIAEKLGDQNYLNKIGSESLTFEKTKSNLEQQGDKFIAFFVAAGIIAAVINFYFARQGWEPTEDIIKSVTALIAIIIPQTLLMMFTLTFVIAVTRMAMKGIIIQKRGAMDDLANIDVLCIDKTGTITANKMKIINAEYTNAKREDFSILYNSVKDKIQGKNKTYEALVEYFSDSEKAEVKNFNQIPFNPKNKFSVIEATINDSNKTLIFGAISSLENFIDEKILNDVKTKVTEYELKGNRVVLGLASNELQIEKDGTIKNLKTNSVAIFIIEEKLNPGIIEVLNQLHDQEIKVNVISGDSLISVSKIIEQVGLKNTQAVDLSKTEKNYKELIEEGYNIFARAKPEDKLEIIKILKDKGHKVAMVGDGINDVLSLKMSHVGIAMESGAKIARDTSDIVLLKNDYKKIPEIFYEGDNIVFNLKLTTKIYLARAIIGILLAVFFAFREEVLALKPTSTLIFSFLGNTIPSYVVAFTRQPVKNQTKFAKEILTSAIPAGIVMGLLGILLFTLRDPGLSEVKLNTYMVLGLLPISFIYTLVLLYQSGKLKKIIDIIALFIFVIGFGIAQTYLPIFNFDWPNEALIMISIILISALIAHLVLRKRAKESNDKQLKRASIIVPLIFIPVALFFPCQTYYNVRPIPIGSFPEIALISGLALLSLVIIEVIRGKIIKNG